MYQWHIPGGPPVLIAAGVVSAFVAALAPLAEAVMDTALPLNMISGGALTIVAYMVYQQYRVENPANREMISALVAASRAQSDADRVAFAADLEQQRKHDMERHNQMTEVLSSMLAQQREGAALTGEMMTLLIRHDATVRGVNPEIMGPPLSEEPG